MQPRERAHRVLRRSIAYSKCLFKRNSAGAHFSLSSPSADRERLGGSRSLELPGTAIEYARRKCMCDLMREQNS